jgi:hypothetical protein
MEDLMISATQYTPEIGMRAVGVVEIKGKSYPENTFEFYKPVMTWLKTYLNASDSPKRLSINCEIIYFNSSSSKMFFDFFDLLLAYNEKFDIRVEWRYDEDNDIAKESGEDFVADFPDLSIALKSF